jgi:hypothetical protein
MQIKRKTKSQPVPILCKDLKPGTVFSYNHFPERLYLKLANDGVVTLATGQYYTDALAALNREVTIINGYFVEE